MTSGAVTQVVYGRGIQIVRSLKEREAHVLNVGVVCSGDVARSAGSHRLALLDLSPPSHPHGYMFSDLWLAVPGHYGTLTNMNLRSSKTGRVLERTSAKISPPREQVLRE